MANVATNLSAAKGRIEDADYAAESANLARTQVLQQASMAMLSQANASKQNILSLFQ
jgi:flagellin